MKPGPRNLDKTITKVESEELGEIFTDKVNFARGAE